MNVSNRKAAVRASMLARRQALSPTEAAAKSRDILATLRQIAVFRESSSILSYVSSKDNEVDTRKLIRDCLASEKRVFAPRVEFRATLTWCELHTLDELVPGRFDIFEPTTPHSADFALATCIITPGIAFGADGSRIGYGGGYFDRFLATFPYAKIALAYDFQVLDDCPHAPHDIAVDIIVTESRILYCESHR